ncbi:MAG: nucleotidyltransferase family protein [Pseudomonadota bacterium]
MSSASEPHIAAIVLAAGGGSRLGESKPLAEVGGETLLERVVGRVTDALGAAPIAVLGSGWPEIVERCRGRLPYYAINEGWRDGQSTSLATGLRAVPPDCDAVLIVLVDQPLILAAHYRELIAAARERPDAVIATAFDGVQGVPVVLPRRLFAQANNLDGDTGARPLLAEAGDAVIAVPCAEAAIDIDTPEELARLRSLKQPE